MEYYDATVRVVHGFDIHAKAERLKEFFRHADRIVHRGSPDDRPWWLIRYSK